MTWIKFEDSGYTPRDGDQRILFNDRGVFVGTWDSDWMSGGWWMIEDGKYFDRPLRGSEPTHFMAVPTPPATE